MNEPKTVYSFLEYLLKLFNDPESARTDNELTSFLDEMPGGFFVYRADDEEQIIYANKSMLHIFKCDTPEEFRELTGNTLRESCIPKISRPWNRVSGSRSPQANTIWIM